MTEKFLPTKITMSRRDNENPYMAISLMDEASRIQFCEVHVALDKFMLALTGLAYVDCEVTLRKPTLVGLTCERRNVKWYHKGKLEYETRHEQVRAAGDRMAAHLGDGWRFAGPIGSWSQSTEGKDEKGEYINISLSRYVGPDVAEKELFDRTFSADYLDHVDKKGIKDAREFAFMVWQHARNAK